MTEPSDAIRKTRLWVEENFFHPVHLLRTELWLLELMPEADEALRLAALLHDIDRAFPPAEGEKLPKTDKYDDPEYLLWHCRRSARYAKNLLKELGAEESVRTEAARLIEAHETGGDPRADALMEADSISFVENNVGFFVREITPDIPSITAKTEYMYRRIKSERALELAKPEYDRVMGKLKTHDAEFKPSRGLNGFGFPR